VPLRPSTDVSTLEVHWPSGIVQQFAPASLPTTPDGERLVVERTGILALPQLPLEVDEGTTLQLGLGNSSSGAPSFPRHVQVLWTILDPLGEVLVRSGLVANITVTIPGVYDLTLHLQEGSASASNATVTVVVRDRSAPTVLLGPTRTVAPGTSVSLSAVRVSDNDPQFSTNGTYLWQVSGPGGPRDLQGRTPEVTLTTPGRYTVSLSARDPSGNVGTANQTIIVSDPAVFGLQPWQWYLIAALALGAVIVMAVRHEGKVKRPAPKGRRRRSRARPRTSSQRRADDSQE